MARICYITTINNTINAFFVPQINYLVNKGFDLTIISNKKVDYSELLDNRVNTINVGISRGVSVYNTIIAILKLKRIFKNEQFDLVQYSTPNAAFCASIASSLAKIRIRNYHIMGFRYLGFTGVRKYFFKAIEKITCRLSTNIECITNGNMELGIKEGIFTKDKATIVWNGSTGGVSKTRFDFSKREEWRKNIRSKLEITNEEFVFLFAGRITRDKGVNELLEAIHYIDNIDKRIRLIIVGRQEGVDTLRQELWTSAKNDERIIVGQRVDNIEEYYAAADFLVLPSYREGFGNVIIEAACMGTPCIASDIPGPSEIIDNIGGIKCQPGNANSLREAMEKAFRERDRYIPVDISNKALSYYDAEVLNQKIYERKQILINSNC